MAQRSVAMLEIARARASEHGVADICEFRVADVFRDGIPGSFDGSIAKSKTKVIDADRTIGYVTNDTGVGLTLSYGTFRAQIAPSEQQPPAQRAQG